MDTLTHQTPADFVARHLNMAPVGGKRQALQRAHDTWEQNLKLLDEKRLTAVERGQVDEWQFHYDFATAILREIEAAQTHY
jgi:hypothetical protein